MTSYLPFEPRVVVEGSSSSSDGMPIVESYAIGHSSLMASSPMVEQKDMNCEYFGAVLKVPTFDWSSMMVFLAVRCFQCSTMRSSYVAHQVPRGFGLISCAVLAQCCGESSLEGASGT